MNLVRMSTIAAAVVLAGACASPPPMINVPAAPPPAVTVTAAPMPATPAPVQTKIIVQGPPVTVTKRPQATPPPPPSWAYWPGTPLSTRHRKDYRPDVELVQRSLNDWGYNLAPDGHYGPQTRSAVSDFQRSYGLQVDGWVGEETWNAAVNRSF